MITTTVPIFLRILSFVSKNLTIGLAIREMIQPIKNGIKYTIILGNTRKQQRIVNAMINKLTITFT